MENARVSEVLEELADLLELQGEESFKVAAYRRAAKSVRTTDSDIVVLWREGRLAELPGVGEAIEKKIDEILRTGTLKLLEEARTSVPKGLVELLSVQHVGPKTALELYKTFGVKDKASLKASLESGELISKGFPAKTASKILESLRQLGEQTSRMLLIEGLDKAYSLMDSLTRSGGWKIYLVGSCRRGRETVGDIDMVALPDKEGSTLLELASGLSGGRFVARGEQKITWVSDDGVQFDFRLANRDDLGAMLIYFTGSKDHDVQLRTLAISKGYKLSEYGLFDSAGRVVAGKTEEEVYARLGLQYIEPELREGAGEIEASLQRRLPTLVDESSVKGDFHVHTNWSDGSNTLSEMVEACVKLGYKFVVITDHSKGEKVANGLSEQRMAAQSRRIEELRKKHPEIELFHGSEVSILRGGKLDYDDETLSKLDYVVASLHRKFTDDSETLTSAVVAALGNRYVDTLGHPTGRILGRRPEYPLMFEKIIDAAAEKGKNLEIDGSPRRMDLPPEIAKKARDRGVTLVASSDAHSTGELLNMQFAVKCARRAWVEKQNLLNSRIFRPNR